MASIEPFPIELGGRRALLPMDSSVEYLRARLWRVLPLYLVAMTPFSLVVLLAIDIIATEHHGAVAQACWLLTAATVWRWLWLGVMQRRVQADILGQSPRSLRTRWWRYLLTRAYANVAMTWGSLAIVPAFYGLFMTGFAAPMLLEPQRTSTRPVRDTLGWIGKGASRLMRITAALAVFTFMIFMSALLLQIFITSTVLPSLLGLDATALSITVASHAWLLCTFYFIFLLLDLYWAVLSVILYYDLQSRRLGADLRVRLRTFEEAPA